MSPAAPAVPSQHTRSRVALAFTIIFLVWGTSYLISRLGVQRLPPFLFAGARFVVAGALMLGYARLRNERVRLSSQEWQDVAAVSLFGFILSNGINIWSLQFVPSNVSALLNASVPCWIALLSAIGGSRRHPLPRELTGLLLGIAGTALVMRPARGAEHVGIVPQIFILGGCLCWAISTLILRRMQSSLSVATLIGWQMLIGGGALLALGCLVGELQRWTWSAAGLWCMAYLIVFASCLAHTSYAWLARHTSPTSLGTYAYVNPMIATAVGWLVLDEALNARQLLGMAVVLTGVLLINWPVGLWRTLHARAFRRAP